LRGEGRRGRYKSERRGGGGEEKGALNISWKGKGKGLLLFLGIGE